MDFSELWYLVGKLKENIHKVSSKYVEFTEIKAKITCKCGLLYWMD